MYIDYGYAALSVHIFVIVFYYSILTSILAQKVELSFGSHLDRKRSAAECQNPLKLQRYRIRDYYKYFKRRHLGLHPAKQ